MYDLTKFEVLRQWTMDTPDLSHREAVEPLVNSNSLQHGGDVGGILLHLEEEGLFSQS